MSGFAERLRAVDGDQRESLARAESRDAPTDELIAALLELGPVGWTEHHLVNALAGRGPEVFEAVAEALLADPRAPGAFSLGEVLVQFFDDDDIRDERVVPAIVRATDAALDAGAGTAGVVELLHLLRDCRAIAGRPLPDAVPLARRVLELAETEPEPERRATAVARRLLAG